MLALQPSTSSPARCTPNLLPCKVHHDGPVNASERYWSPHPETDGQSTAHFRGRRLRGRTVKVPDGYRGAVVKKSDQHLPIPKEGVESDQVADADSEDGVESSGAEVQILDEMASFDKIVSWGHDVLPDKANDSHMFALEEFISFAEQIHSLPMQSESAGKPDAKA